MKEKILYILILLLISVAPAFAEKIPVKIAPIHEITTYKDKIEVGDLIPFQTVNDVYVGDKLYIPKYSAIFGKVDFLHSNGWGGDAAEVKLKYFYVNDVNGKRITIDYPLIIKGNCSRSNDIKQYVSMVIYIIRGAEVYVEPDTISFNIFIEQ